MLNQLSGVLTFPIVRKRLGKEMDSLVAQVNELKNVSFKDHVKAKVNDMVSFVLGRRSLHADINIFTIASGHLYERMTYIMILRYVLGFITTAFYGTQKAQLNFGLSKTSCRLHSKLLFLT